MSQATLESQSNLAEAIASLSPDQREVFIKRLPPAAAERVKEILSDYATDQAQKGFRVNLLPHQRIPEPDQIKRGHVFSGGRGAGKTLASANYAARLGETVPKIRMRCIAPTLSDAVNAFALDPDSGVLAQSPSATFKSTGIEGARIIWPNGSVCYLVGTPTLKDVDRLRALTNIDCDFYEEAAANPRLKEATQQADLSRRGKRLGHPIWIAATTPRPVPTYQGWLKDSSVTVTHATTMDNPYTPDSYREYAESLKGTHLYDQEVLGLVVEDVRGALWSHANIEKSMVTDSEQRTALMKTLSKVVVGVDPPSGNGTCGIVVMGVTDKFSDPTGNARVVVLDDFSISEASPMQWGDRVIDASVAYDAPVIAERNQGGLMVEDTIRKAAESRDLDFLPVTLATAVISKERRAAPIALLWEVSPQRAVIAPPDGNLARISELTGQMATWIPKAFSPDNLDAMVWAATHLIQGGGGNASGTLATPSIKPKFSRAVGFSKALMGRLER